MYLTDREIRSRLADFEFGAEDTEAPFDPDNQIGPCSIDLRVSKVFWIIRHARVPPMFRRRIVDLERSRIMELSPTRGWRRVEIESHEKITIKPGHMVLARTAEVFQMPSDCAGRLEGRSSYARLGLTIHSTGGFINPGWRGHMPLTLANHSSVTLRIPVGTPLCQLLVVKLDSPPEADYAERGDRKYVNDLGGPSLWWRDVIMRGIRTKLAKVRLDERAFDELEELLAGEDDDTIGRLEDFLAKQGSRSYGSGDELLSGFAKAEQRRHRFWTALHVLAIAGWTVTGGLFLTAWLGDGATWQIWLSAALVLASLGFLVWGVSTSVPNYLTLDRLRKLQAQRDRGAIVELANDPTDSSSGATGTAG